MATLQEVIIDTESIKLDQFLKWVSAVSTGGEAKLVIAEGKVKINGAVELQRGKQLHKGDIVEIAGAGTFKVV